MSDKVVVVCLIEHYCPMRCQRVFLTDAYTPLETMEVIRDLKEPVVTEIKISVNPVSFELAVW